MHKSYFDGKQPSMVYTMTSVVDTWTFLVERRPLFLPKLSWSLDESSSANFNILNEIQTKFFHILYINTYSSYIISISLHNNNKFYDIIWKNSISLLDEHPNNY